MSERPTFLDRYEAVAVPEPIVSRDDTPEEGVEETVEDFFRQVQDALGLGNVTLELFERTARPIDTSESQRQPEAVETFRLMGGQVIASVLRLSDEPGSVTVRFARYGLLDETQRAISGLHSLERVIDNLEQS